MRANLDLTSSLGRTTWEGRECDVFATAHAAYDPPAGTLTVTLDSYLRPEDLTHLDQKIVPPWLPPAQVDREHVDANEATDLAREIFRRWCGRVQHQIPQPGRR